MILSSLSLINYSKEENSTDISIIFLNCVFPQGFPRDQELWKNLFKNIYIRWVCVEKKENRSQKSQTQGCLII